ADLLFSGREDRRAGAGRARRARDRCVPDPTNLVGLCSRRPMEAQEIMDYQVRVISDWQEKFDSLHRDREKAQEIMDAQAEQLIALRREARDLKQQIKEQKRILREPKVERPIAEKIVRELRRLPRNLRRMFLLETKAAP